jgi:glycosyl transferase family 1
MSESRQRPPTADLDRRAATRLVVASPGGWSKPSTAYRIGPLARSKQWPVQVLSVATYPSKSDLATMQHASDGDAVLILRRVMPGTRDIRELRRSFLGVVFDFDDAIYAVPPNLGRSRLSIDLKRASRSLIRGSADASSRRRPLLRVVGEVDVVVAGNEILADFVRSRAQAVTVIPTTVTPVDGLGSRPTSPVLVWMGLPANIQYLELLRDALVTLHRRSSFSLRIVSSKPWHSSPIPTDFIPWSPDAAREALTTASVGLAPLTDDPWTRGKCAFRAIQYGAHGLPTVASPVGITDKVVIHGRTGYLANATSDWLTALERLIQDRNTQTRLGKEALKHIRHHYSDSVSVKAWQSLVETLIR